MRSRIKLACLVVALVMVGAACGGGGGEAPQAADEIPTRVPIEEGDFDFVDEIRGGTPAEAEAPEGGETDGQVVAEPEAVEISNVFENPGDRAMSMVLVPEDLPDLAALSLDPVGTDEVSNLDDAYELADRADAAVAAPEGRITGYRSSLHSDGAVGPESMITEVHIYGSAESAAARVAMERELLAEDSVGAVTGLPDGAFVGSFDDGAKSVVWFANGGVVARVEAEGADTAVASVAAAKELGLRVFRVEQASVDLRDPYPTDAAYHLPHRRLDRFAATSSLVVKDAAGERVAWWRSSGVYEAPERFSCRIVEGTPGAESMVVDLTVDGDTAQLWTLNSPALRELAATDSEIVAALDRCPTVQAELESLVVVDMAATETARGSTLQGPATTYRSITTATDEGDVEFAGDGQELARYIAYVDADGWLASIDWNLLTTAGAVEFDVDGLGADEPVWVEYQFDVTDAGSDDLAIEALHAYEGMQTLVIASDG